MRVCAKESDSLPRLKAGLSQRARQQRGAFRKLLICESLSSGDDGGSAGVLALCVAKKPKGSKWNIHRDQILLEDCCVAFLLNFSSVQSRRQS
jgi:hypothetical protein